MYRSYPNVLRVSLVCYPRSAYHLSVRRVFATPTVFPLETSELMLRLGAQ